MCADRDQAAAYPSICSAHQERVEGCPLCYPEPTAAKLLLPAVYVKRERDLKRLVHFSYITPKLFIYWRLP